MGIQPVELSIAEIKSLYGIKESTAYKWRKFLRDNDLAVDQINCDRINNRELNMTESAIVTVEEPQIQHQPVNHPVETVSAFGLTFGRLEELNAEAKLEVIVKSRLKEFHESELQSQRSQELSQRSQEVKDLDPKNLATILKNLGIA